MGYEKKKKKKDERAWKKATLAEKDPLRLFSKRNFFFALVVFGGKKKFKAKTAPRFMRRVENFTFSWKCVPNVINNAIVTWLKRQPWRGGGGAKKRL